MLGARARSRRRPRRDPRACRRRAPLGTDVREVLGLDDVVFDLAITPNRPDAMGIVGVARELAAHFGLPLAVEAHEPRPGRRRARRRARCVVEAPDRCPRFVGVVARIVRWGSRPTGCKRRLALAGMRPISNVVDVTNYVMLERCRPLHAFDLGRLAGRGIVVRLARDGEKMTTLDGVERELTRRGPADLRRRARRRRASPASWAAPPPRSPTRPPRSCSSRRTSSPRVSPRRRSGSDSVPRRARASSAASTPTVPAPARRARWSCCARSRAPSRSTGAIDVYPQPIERATHRGAHRPCQPAARHRAGRCGHRNACSRRSGSSSHDGVALAPTFRPDLEREIDLVEEVARRVGLDRIPRTVPVESRRRSARSRPSSAIAARSPTCSSVPATTRSTRCRCWRRSTSSAWGAAHDDVIEVENPLRAEESVLRPALLPGVLRAVAFNAAHGEPAVAVFEAGTVFGRPLEGETLPREHLHARVRAFALGSARSARAGPTGRRVRRDRGLARVDAGAADRRTVGSRRRLSTDFTPGAPHDRGRRCGGRRGRRGRRRGRHARSTSRARWSPPSSTSTHSWPRRRVPRFAHAGLAVPGILRRPRVRRRRHGARGRDRGDAREGGRRTTRVGRVLRRVPLRGARIAGNVSLAFALRFRAPDRTLTDDEIGGLRRACIDAVAASHNAELRA